MTHSAKIIRLTPYDLAVSWTCTTCYPAVLSCIQCPPPSAGDVTVDYSDDEDSRDATPITPLEPYDLVLQDLTVPVGVNKLHNLLVGSKSALIASHWAAEGLLDLQVGLWQLAPAGAVYLRSRQVSYIKKLNIPLPLAPKQCQV